MPKCQCGVDGKTNDDNLCPECADKLEWDRNDYEKTRKELPR